MEAPQLILIKFLFEDEKLNKGTLINVSGCKSIKLEEEPGIEKKLDILNGIEYNILKESVIKITVNYEEGIRLDDEIQMPSGNLE